MVPDKVICSADDLAQIVDAAGLACEVFVRHGESRQHTVLPKPRSPEERAAQRAAPADNLTAVVERRSVAHGAARKDTQACKSESGPHKWFPCRLRTILRIVLLGTVAMPEPINCSPVLAVIPGSLPPAKSLPGCNPPHISVIIGWAARASSRVGHSNNGVCILPPGHCAVTVRGRLSDSNVGNNSQSATTAQKASL